MFKGLTEKEVSEMLGVSLAKLRRDRWLHIGIPFVKLNRSVRYLEEDIEQAVRQGRVETKAG